MAILFDRYRQRKNLRDVLEHENIASKTQPQTNDSLVVGQQYPDEVMRRYNSPDNKAGNFKDLSQINSEYEQEQAGKATKPVQPQQVEINPDDAIGSVVEMLGPTPAEREAQRAKMERNRKRMTMWTALFDGLRQLGNLYYTSKGARPQRYGNPYAMIDLAYKRQKQEQDDNDNYRRQYAQSLYNLQRQQSDGMRRARLIAAQIKAYEDAEKNREAKLQQREKELEEKRRQFDERQRQNQRQFEQRQQQQREIAEKRRKNKVGKKGGNSPSVEITETFDGNGEKQRRVVKTKGASQNQNKSGKKVIKW